MKPQRYHLEIQKRKTGVYGLIRSSFRRDGKVVHKTVGFLSGMSLDQLLILQAGFQGKIVPSTHENAPVINDSKEYGASFALLALAKQLELDRILYSRVYEPWVQDCLAMIVGRVIYAGSKLSLSNRWKDSVLWDLCGTEGPVNVQLHCYEPMDRLLERQSAIQRALVRKHFDGSKNLVFYDITSSFMEGEYKASRLVLFGYNRDRKKGHAQIVFGLVCTAEGCPCAVEVFAGNTKDASTVQNKIAEIRKRYGIKEVVFVGDRGMITPVNFEVLQGVEGLRIISALTHREMAGLLERKVVQMELFDERRINEVVDPKDPSVRYCLCRNPQSAERETKTRQALMERTGKALDQIASRKKRAAAQRIGAQVGKIFGRTKMAKFVHWEVKDGRLVWQWRKELVTEEGSMDGCYVVRTNVDSSRMDKNQVVGTYKKLALVEQAFRNLKTVQLEVRPVHHKEDHRMESHVLVCMLAYYLQWHMEQRLIPLFEKNGQGKDRFWTIENVIERLKSIRRQTIKIEGVSCSVVSTPDPEQTEILNLLKIKL